MVALPRRRPLTEVLDAAVAALLPLPGDEGGDRRLVPEEFGLVLEIIVYLLLDLFDAFHVAAEIASLALELPVANGFPSLLQQLQ